MLICQSCYSTYDEEYRSKECPHELLTQIEMSKATLEERVNALESALKAQDSVHKMNVRAIASSLRGLLDDFIDDLEEKN